MKAKLKTAVETGVQSLLVGILLFLLPGSAGALQAPLLNFSTQEMAPNAPQPLSIMNYRSGQTYTWQLSCASGNCGSLSANEGDFVVYTAPAGNPDCSNNPTVTVTASDGQNQMQAELGLAINANGNFVSVNLTPSSQSD